MLGSLRNRYTKFSVLVFSLAIIGLTLGVTNWPKESLTIYLITFAVVLFVGSVSAEVFGIYEARHFLKEDALHVYQEVTQLIKELRSLASVLHKDYNDKLDKHRKYIRDKQYKQLMKKFTKVRLKCCDYILERKLRKLIENESLLAKYSLNAAEFKSEVTLEGGNQDIINYINTTFRTREASQKE